MKFEDEAFACPQCGQDLRHPPASELKEENARLSAENAELEEHRHVYNKNRKDLLESNARLREALEQIVRVGYTGAEFVAREALRGKNGRG